MSSMIVSNVDIVKEITKWQPSDVEGSQVYEGCSFLFSNQHFNDGSSLIVENI